MTGGRLPGRRRWPTIAFAVATTVVALAWTVRNVVLRDQARSVPVDEAVDDFREAPSVSSAPASSSAAPGPARTPSGVGSTGRSSPSETTEPPPAAGTPRLVDPGVYRYRTTGGERIDALGGTSHDYPVETTITVVADGCGVRLRWDALRERREEWSLCATADGIELQPTAIQYHEFYGQGEAELLTCDRTVVLVPTDGSPSAPVTLDCTLADDHWSPRWEVLEVVERRLDGEPILVRHVRMTIDDTDEYWEDQVADWYLAPDGLPVGITVVKSSRSPSVVGPVVYDEQYDLSLVSREPLR